MAYSVNFTKKAFKSLGKISEPYYSNIKDALTDLSKEPRPNGYKKLKGRAAFRIRVANYRIIYRIQDDILLIDIIDIGHRKDIYKRKH